MYTQLSLDFIRRSVNIALAIWMYFVFKYCQYMTYGYCSQRSPGSFRAQIHKLKKANKWTQLSIRGHHQFDLRGQRQLFCFSSWWSCFWLETQISLIYGCILVWSPCAYSNCRLTFRVIYQLCSDDSRTCTFLTGRSDFYKSEYASDSRRSIFGRIPHNQTRF